MQESRSGPVLVASGLHKSFGSTPALRGASITVAPGELVAVTGPSGSGKSTLLHCLAGIVVPDSGVVTFRGHRLDELDVDARTRLRRLHLGLVLQFGQLVAELTALENVALPLLLEGRGRRSAEQAARQWLGELGVGSRADVRPPGLSGGEQQRVAIARGLVTSPDAVLADEPTGALDTVTGEQALGVLVKAVRETGAALVVVTHDHRIGAWMDREVALWDGRTQGRVRETALGQRRRRRGRARPALVVASTAVVSGLLLVAVSYARLGGNGEFGYGYPRGDAPLLAPITDPGTRGGAILAVILTTVPVALLLDQCVRLGTTAQRRRYEALGVAGATRADLRRWGAVETGVPALLGALLGIGVWLLLRLFLGTGLADSGRGGLVPTVTGPGWWTLLVVGLVAAYGVLVGARAAGRATAAIRREAGPPRPWGLLLVVFAVVALPFAFSDTSSDLLLYAAVAAAPLGIMSAAPSLAYVMSGRVTRRTDQAAVLLAARRIRADHGAAGRAAAAVGGVGLTLGVAGELVADLLSAPDQYDLGYYLVPAFLVGGLALLAVGMIAFSLTLHSIEATLSRRRAMSALVATGVPTDTLEEATRAEGRLVTLPLAVVSASLGALVAQAVLADHAAALLGGLVAVAVTVGSVLLAVRVAARAARPWLREAVAVGNLRTE